MGGRTETRFGCRCSWPRESGICGKLSVDSESGDKIFDSPEFYDGYISLHLKYDNGIEAIYEVAYGDTVQVPNEHGIYPRDVTGKP
jgi:hypothetical protein